MPSKTFLNRLTKLQSCFKTWKADGCLIENPLDLFYLTGLQLSLGILIVLPSKAKLFVDGRYIEFAKKNSPFPVELLSQDAVSAFLRPVRTLVFDSYTTTMLRNDQLKKLCSGVLQGVPQPLRELRLIKDAAELKLMKKSAAVVWKGFEHIRKSLKTGVTEKELALSFEIFCRKHGCRKTLF